jgi:prepilin signal peptidase PulO-like enzyme (type II secretory pathway)
VIFLEFKIILIGFILGCFSFQIGRSIDIKFKDIFYFREKYKILIIGIITAMTFQIIYNSNFPHLTVIKTFIFIILLLIISINDYYYLNIRLEFLIIAFIPLILTTNYESIIKFLVYLTHSIIIFFILTLIIKVFKNLYGEGDIYLLSYICLFYGVDKTLDILFYSILFGGIICCYLLLFKLVKRNDSLPFVPMILIGYLSTIFLDLP